MKEGVDDLGVMEFGVTSLTADITNMHKRIELQKEQLKMTQKFLEKLEKEKRDIEVRKLMDLYFERWVFMIYERRKNCEENGAKSFSLFNHPLIDSNNHFLIFVNSFIH